jgi:hypothetical protein
LARAATSNRLAARSTTMACWTLCVKRIRTHPWRMRLMWVIVVWTKVSWLAECELTVVIVETFKTTGSRICNYSVIKNSLDGDL